MQRLKILSQSKRFLNQTRQPPLLSSSSVSTLFSKQTFQHCCPHHTTATKYPTSSSTNQKTSGAPVNNTFVSGYYKISENDIFDFITRKGLVYKAISNEVIVKDCPFCHSTKGQQANLWKLYIHRQTGAYMCHRCGSKGSWYDLKNKLQFGDRDDVIQPMVDQKKQELKKKVSKEDIEDYKVAFSTARYPELNNFITSRGITTEVAEKYGVGAAFFKFYTQNEGESPKSVNELCITFPMYKPIYKPSSLVEHLKKKEADRKEKPQDQEKDSQANAHPIPDDFQVVRHKIRAISDKSLQKLDPAGGQWGLFGLNTVPPEATTIVLTEGEFDAMAVHQATGLPTVSLPNGCRSLPVDILPILERYDRIYLWMDDDIPGQEGVEQFTNKLGIGRCFIVHSSTSADKLSPPPKDANEALVAGVDLKKCIDEAAPLNHSRIITFGDMKKDIYRELYENSLEVTGIPSKFFPKMNKILKGHRRGELTVITGPTGIGKTTILSQMTLDYAVQGINTLWGSFEIKNHRLATKMLCQLAGKGLSAYKNEFDAYSDQFERLPLYFMNFYGSTDVDQVLDAMDYAVYVYDVQHIIIDNLQFMMSGQGIGYEKFEMQDKAIEKFRLFATQKNVHLTVVIHPKKVEDGLKLGLASIFGTAKATQEADNVIIIQTGKKYRSLMVKKNRFDGTLGEMPYRFDRDSSRIYELTDDQLKEVEEGKIELEY